MVHLPPPVNYEELPLGALDASRIEALWCFRTSTRQRQWVLPDGRMDLVAHCTVGARQRIDAVWLAIAGPADAPASLPVRADRVSLGARFQIGWGGRCLGVDPAAMRNRVIAGKAVADLVGDAAQAMLRSRHVDALQAALADAAGVLARRAASSPGHERALRAIRQVADGVPSCPTERGAERTLRRDVLSAAGLSLRTLAGILRFQRCMQLLRTASVPSLAELAACAGYTDQAHMTREFRRFGGFTPALPGAVPVIGVHAPQAHGHNVQDRRPVADAQWGP